MPGDATGVCTMTRPWRADGRAGWLLGGSAMGAAALILASPWYPSPFSVAVQTWLVGAVQIWLAGHPGIAVAHMAPAPARLTLNLALTLGGTVVAVLPWLGLPLLVPVTRRRDRIVPVAPIAGLVLLVALGMPALGERAIKGPFGPWQLAALASVAALGVSLVASGALVRRAAPRSRLSTFGAALIASGACLATLVAVPLGILGLAISYALLSSLWLTRKSEGPAVPTMRR